MSLIKACVRLEARHPGWWQCTLRGSAPCVAVHPAWHCLWRASRGRE